MIGLLEDKETIISNQFFSSNIYSIEMKVGIYIIELFICDIEINGPYVQFFLHDIRNCGRA